LEIPCNSGWVIEFFIRPVGPPDDTLIRRLCQSSNFKSTVQTVRACPELREDERDPQPFGIRDPRGDQLAVVLFACGNHVKRNQIIVSAEHPVLAAVRMVVEHTSFNAPWRLFEPNVENLSSFDVHRVGEVRWFEKHRLLP